MDPCGTHEVTMFNQDKFIKTSINRTKTEWCLASYSVNAQESLCGQLCERQQTAERETHSCNIVVPD